jgi:hypothetical protein
MEIFGSTILLTTADINFWLLNIHGLKLLNVVKTGYGMILNKNNIVYIFLTNFCNTLNAKFGDCSCHIHIIFCVIYILYFVKKIPNIVNQVTKFDLKRHFSFFHHFTQICNLKSLIIFQIDSFLKMIFMYKVFRIDRKLKRGNVIELKCQLYLTGCKNECSSLSKPLEVLILFKGAKP